MIVEMIENADKKILEISRRILADYISICYYLEEGPHIHYLDDDEVKTLEELEKWISNSGVIIDDSIKQKCLFSLYEEKLRHIYDRVTTSPREESFRTKNISDKEYDELTNLRNRFLTSGIEIDNIVSGRLDEMFATIGMVYMRGSIDFIDFADTIIREKPGQFFCIIGNDKKKIFFDTTTSNRSEILKTFQRICNDPRLNDIEIVSEEDFNIFERILKESGFVLIYGESHNEELSINVCAPDEIDDFQKQKLTEIDVYLSMYGESNVLDPDTMKIINQIRNIIINSDSNKCLKKNNNKKETNI